MRILTINILVITAVLTSVSISLAGTNKWTGSGPFANYSGIERIVMGALALSPDGKTVSAGNTNGTVFDYTRTPPTVSTLSASAVGTTTATLNGSVNANDAMTQISFEYGETAGYGYSMVSIPSILSGAVNTAVSASPSGLHPGGSYHFRVIAINSGGSSIGGDQSFNTGLASFELSVSIPAGQGIGSVQSDIGKISCNNGGTPGKCNATYLQGTPVTLTATTSLDSTFIGWSVDCIGVAPCNINMSSGKNVTANFGLDPKARMVSTGYATLNDAYSAAGANATIQVVAGDRHEELILNQGKNIIINGGYTSKFDTPTANPTILKGLLSIQSGSLRVDRMKIRPVTP